MERDGSVAGTRWIEQTRHGPSEAHQAPRRVLGTKFRPGGFRPFLCRLAPAPDERAELAGCIVARAAADREITRVEHLVRESGIGARALQRLFADYVGVSPKWVIQRYRLHEAAERIAAGAVRDWAALALDLGYADQAHFIRDFRHWVGCSPGEYSRELGEPLAVADQ